MSWRTTGVRALVNSSLLKAVEEGIDGCEKKKGGGCHFAKKTFTSGTFPPTRKRGPRSFTFANGKKRGSGKSTRTRTSTRARHPSLSKKHGGGREGGVRFGSRRSKKKEKRKEKSEKVKNSRPLRGGKKRESSEFCRDATKEKEKEKKNRQLFGKGRTRARTLSASSKKRKRKGKKDRDASPRTAARTVDGQKAWVLFTPAMTRKKENHSTLSRHIARKKKEKEQSEHGNRSSDGRCLV